MSLELIKDRIKIDQLVGSERVESLVEGEISLPDHKPKIDKLISLGGDVEITNQLLKEDTLIVTGLVKFKTLYTTEEDDEQLIHSLESKTDFREEISLASSYDAKAVVTAAIEHIEYTKLTDEKIGVKTVIDIDAKLRQEGTVEIIKDLEGGEGVETLKETVKYSELIASTTTRNTVKDTFEIEECNGDVLDILSIDTDVRVNESRVVDGKVIVAGDVKCFILYYSDDEDNTINYIKEDIPFTHFAEIEGAEAEMNYSLDIEVKELSHDVRGDINGNLRIIDLETSVKIDARVYQQSEKEILTDTYSTVKKFEVKNENILLTQNLAKHNIEEVLKQDIEVKGEEIVNLCNVSAKACITDKRVLEEKVIVEGIAEVQMIYISKDQALKVWKSEIPYKSYIDIDKYDSKLDIEAKSIIDDVSYNKLDDKQIEVEISLTNIIEVNTIKDINIVNEAKELEGTINKKDRASITIYMVQKKDSLWKIAKRYSTTVEDICSTNDIEEENLKLGQKIIIEKHVDTTLQAYA